MRLSGALPAGERPAASGHHLCGRGDLFAGLPAGFRHYLHGHSAAGPGRDDPFQKAAGNQPHRHSDFCDQHGADGGGGLQRGRHGLHREAGELLPDGRRAGQGLPAAGAKAGSHFDHPHQKRPVLHRLHPAVLCGDAGPSHHLPHHHRRVRRGGQPEKTGAAAGGPGLCPVQQRLSGGAAVCAGGDRGDRGGER